MKTKLLIFILTFIILIIIPIPNYVELNQLVLLDSITVTCSSKNYEISVKEIIPKKEDNGIKYDYKTYKASGGNLLSAKKVLEKDISKKIYYQGIKKITTNCSNTEEIFTTFSIKKTKKIKIERD